MSAERFRWRVLRIGKPDRVGKWHPDRLGALRAGTRAGVIKYDERTGYYLDVLTKIEREAVAD